MLVKFNKLNIEALIDIKEILKRMKMKNEIEIITDRDYNYNFNECKIDI